MDANGMNSAFTIALTVIVIFCFVVGLSFGLFIWWVWG